MDILQEIDSLQTELVERWHMETPGVQREGILGVVEEQHLQNFSLWHEEDIARAPDVEDGVIAQVKRNIDRFNQRRNDLIERIDELILLWMDRCGIDMPLGAPLNSETPGNMIDRCSIMALKIYHMKEQAERKDVNEEHIARAQAKVETLQEQRHDLLQCLFHLIEEIQQGTRQFRIYRQFKMYNDPKLNPKIYQASKSQ